MDIITALLTQTSIFLLIFSRISGIFTISPIFGSRNVPISVKVGLCILISYILLPAITSSNVTVPQTLWPYVGLVASEFLFGVILGFASNFIFYGIQMSGQILDMQVGFGMVNIFDPQFGQQVPLLGNFKYILAILLFLITNGHHIFLSALFNSFELIPITGIVFKPALGEFFLNLFTGMFVITLKICLPVIVAIMLAEAALGILSRTMPQMNIFIVGMPAKIMVGLFALSIGLPFYLAFVEIGFNGMYKSLYGLMSLFR